MNDPIAILAASLDAAAAHAGVDLGDTYAKIAELAEQTPETDSGEMIEIPADAVHSLDDTFGVKQGTKGEALPPRQAAEVGDAFAAIVSEDAGR